MKGKMTQVIIDFKNILEPQLATEDVVIPIKTTFENPLNFTPRDYQNNALRTFKKKDLTLTKDSLAILEAVLGLAGECGECVDEVKKHVFHEHPLNKEHLIEELGDVAWYLAVACEALGTSLDVIMYENIKKLHKRYPNGFDPKKSINRTL